MALRPRLMLMAAASVGVAILLAAVVAYVAVRNELRGQIDQTLRDQARLVQRIAVRNGFFPGAGPGAPPPERFGPLPAPRPRADAPNPYLQLISPGGDVLQARGAGVRIAPDARERRIAGTGQGGLIDDRESGGVHVRVLTQPIAPGVAVQVARSLASTDSVLHRLRLILALLAAAGVIVAAALARLLARTVIRPLSRLEGAVDHVTRTDDLSRRIEATGDDEVGRLGRRFNAMLETLEGSRHDLARSVEAQRQLVADASHELRTPVTSLRTNLEVLAGDRLGEPERARVLGEAVGQTEELSALIADVIELARGDAPAAETEDVRLDALVSEAIERARRFTPDVRFSESLAATAVQGVPDRLARAVNNLLDNAVKHSPPGGTVEVAVHDGIVTVRDHGPGVPAAEAPHIFDRFYRGNGSRERPGSGLGLAIVRQVAATHGGGVSVEDAPGGGARFVMRLPAG